MAKIQNNHTKENIKDKIISVILNNKALVILILLIIFFSLTSEVLFRPKNLINIVRQVSVSSIVGVGFTMVVASENLDLSVGRMLGLIGVLTAMLSKVPGMPMIVVVFAAIFLGGLCGFLNGFIGTTFRIPMFITTVAMSGMFQGVCYIVSHSATIVQIPKAYSFLGQGYLGPIPILIMIFMAVIVAVILYRMRLGRYILAIGGNKEAARAAGVNVNATTIKVYVLMGICVGVGALIMTGRASAAQPDAGAGMELDTIAAVVIGGTRIGGGVGNVGGTIVGCLMVGVIINGLNLIGVDVHWQMVAKSALIIISVVLDSASTSFFKNRELKKVAA